MKKQTKSQRKKNNMGGLSIEAHRDNFQFAEAFRTLRVSILFSFMEKDLRTLLVTSPAPSEEKPLRRSILATHWRRPTKGSFWWTGIFVNPSSADL